MFSATIICAQLRSNLGGFHSGINICLTWYFSVTWFILKKLSICSKKHKDKELSITYYNQKVILRIMTMETKEWYLLLSSLYAYQRPWV